MSETDKDHKPQPELDDNLVFHYDREHRLSRASDNVRWLASRYGAKRPGFFSSLVATRASRLLLTVIILCVFFYFLYPILHSPTKKSGLLDGAKFSASALYYDGQVLVAIKREGKALVQTLRLRSSLLADFSRSGEASFPMGENTAGDYRAGLKVGAERPKIIYLKLEAGGKELSLVVPVE
jgi:hypothetical protein